MENYKLWIKKAKDDLLWTKHNIESKVYYGACFTAQQSAEKALKCFLVFSEKPLRKIHDVNTLLDECITISPDFKNLKKEAKTLYSYYVETRYPDFEGLSSFTKKQAKEAFESARKVIEFIEKKLK